MEMDSESKVIPVGDSEMGSAVESALMKNDYSKLTSDQKVIVYKKVCESVGLNYLTNPFGFYRQKDGTEKMYAQRACADQLRSIHGVSLVEMKEEFRDDVFSVIVTMKTKDGRQDIDRGDVFVGGLKGLDLANARMRAMTKAKRRCTLSLCGLGWLDETEVQDSPGLRPISVAVGQASTAEPTPAPAPAPFDDIKDRLKIAFANYAHKTGKKGSELAKEISERFQVKNFTFLDEENSKLILNWLESQTNNNG
jgi:hypothetical protein